MSSAKGLDGYTPFDVGTGRVDVAAAVEDTVRATASLFFGNYLWPHDPSQVAITKDLTFTNDGAQDVTLDLALTASGDAFTLSDPTVTVPAGGKATVQVTGDPQAAAIGTDAGWVVGTDEATGKAVTRTSVAPAQGGRALRPDGLAGRPQRPARSRLGGVQPGRRRLGRVGRVRRRLEDPADASRDYSATTFLDVKGEGPDRSGLAVLVDPEIHAPPVHRRGARRPRRRGCCRPRRRSAARTASARSTSASSTARAWSSAAPTRSRPWWTTSTSPRPTR